MKKNVKIKVTIGTNLPVINDGLYWQLTEEERKNSGRKSSSYCILVESTEDELFEGYLMEYVLGFVERYSFIFDFCVTDIQCDDINTSLAYTALKKAKKSIMIGLFPGTNCLLADKNLCDCGSVHEETKTFKEDTLTIPEFCDFVLSVWRATYVAISKKEYKGISYKTINDFMTKKVKIFGKKGYVIENIVHTQRGLVLAGMYDLKAYRRDNFHIYPLVYNKDDLNKPYKILQEGEISGKLYGWFISETSPDEIFKGSKKEKRLTKKTYVVLDNLIAFGLVYTMFHSTLPKKYEADEVNV